MITAANVILIKMDKRGWLNATSDIQKNNIIKKQRKSKLHTKNAGRTIKYKTVTNTGKSANEGFISMPTFEDDTRDTSKYRQTNINRYLKTKSIETNGEKYQKIAQKEDKNHGKNFCSLDKLMLDFSTSSSQLDFHRQDTGCDDSQFSPPITTDKVLNHIVNDVPNLSQNNFSNTEFFESEPIFKLKQRSVMENRHIKSRNQQPELQSAVGKFENHELTLLAKLHEESCNTQLDPESDSCGSGASKKTMKDSCIEKLHAYSCNTNLDPHIEFLVPAKSNLENLDDTQLDPESNSISSTQTKQNSCIDKLHAHSCNTNLDPYTEFLVPAKSNLENFDDTQLAPESNSISSTTKQTKQNYCREKLYAYNSCNTNLDPLIKFLVPAKSNLKNFNDTQLDPESNSISSTAKQTKQNYCIDKLHAYSCNTNLDPYTELPAGMKYFKSKQELLDIIHMESLQTNLDPFKEPGFSNVSQKQPSHVEFSVISQRKKNQFSECQTSKNLKDFEYDTIPIDVNDQYLYSNFDPFTEESPSVCVPKIVDEFKSNHKSLDRNYQSSLKDGDAETSATTQRQNVIIAVNKIPQVIPQWKKQGGDHSKTAETPHDKDRNVLLETSTNRRIPLVPARKRSFEVYTDNIGTEFNEKMINNKPAPSILKDKIIFNDGSSDSPDSLIDLKMDEKRKSTKKSFDKENILSDSFWDG